MGFVIIVFIGKFVCRGSSCVILVARIVVVVFNVMIVIAIIVIASIKDFLVIGTFLFVS